MDVIQSRFYRKTSRRDQPSFYQVLTKNGQKSFMQFFCWCRVRIFICLCACLYVRVCIDAHAFNCIDEILHCVGFITLSPSLLLRMHAKIDFFIKMTRMLFCKLNFKKTPKCFMQTFKHREVHSKLIMFILF